MINLQSVTHSDMYSQRGAAVLIFVIFFLFASLALVYILSNGILSDQKAQGVLAKSKQSYFTALSANEDILYRYVQGMVPNNTESITLAGATAVSTVTVDGATGNYHITSDSTYLQAERSSIMILAVTPGIAFNFGMQSGAGGIELQNTASVEGNVYSNGPITGSNSANVNGDMISAGPAGRIDGVDSTGSAYANTLTGSMVVGGHAYYQSIGGSVNVTNGASYKHPGSPDQPLIPLPIDDDTILGWEAEAQAGGTYLGCSSPTATYTIETDVILGPLYIPCNLEIDKNGTDVTLNGPIWVKGNVTIKKGTVTVGAAMAGKIIPIIAHKSTVSDSGKVVIQNGTSFTSATGNSYIMVVSMNNSGETGGSDPAIIIQNSSIGKLLLYAPHGILQLENSASLKQATAWKITAKNSAIVQYEEGLANPNFTSGPGGSFAIDDWEETY